VISSAVRSTTSSGRSPTRTAITARTSNTANTPNETNHVATLSRCIVSSTDFSETATVAMLRSGWSTARTRKPEPPSLPDTVNGLPFCLRTSAAFT
jgi:hypothetical protein